MASADAGGSRCEQCGGPILGKGRRDRKYCSGSCRTVAWQKRSGNEGTGSTLSRAIASVGLVNRLADELLGRLAKAGESAGSDQQASANGTKDEEQNFLPDRIAVEGLYVPLASGRNPEMNLEPSKKLTPANRGLLLLKSIGIAPPVRRDPPSAGRPMTVEELASAPAYLRRPAEEKPRGQQMEKVEAPPATDAAASAFVAELKARIKKQVKRNKALTRTVSEWEERYAELKKEADELKKEADELKKEADELRKAQKKLPAWPDGDPLVMLMRTKVLLQHRLAVRSAEEGDPSENGRLLPDDKPETQDAAARQAAYAARRRYFALWERKKPGRTKWRVEGKRLDQRSEERLLRREQEEIHELETDLSLFRPLGTPK